MTEQEIKQHILEFVESMNRKRAPVNYRIVQAHIEKELSQKVPIRTIRRYDESCAIKWRKTREITPYDDDDYYWSIISQFRRLLQPIPNNRLIFIDEIAIYFNMFPRRTLVAFGQQPLVLVKGSSTYPKRFDFIGAINGSQPIASMTLTSADCNNRHIKGFRQNVIHEWITDTLAPAISQLGLNNLYLICDRSPAHNPIRMTQALRAGNCYSVTKVLYLPTASAKYLSPLDNPLWHSLREVIRNQHPLISEEIPILLSRTFYSLSTQEIENAYRKCGYAYGIDECYDRP